MSGWMRESAAAMRALAEERAVLEATEMVCERIEERDISRTDLAARLGISRSEVTQRLSGKRNLSVKTLAAMLHEMGFQLCLGTRDLTGRGSELRPFHAAPQSSWTSHLGAVKYTPTGSSLRLVSARPAA